MAQTSSSSTSSSSAIITSSAMELVRELRDNPDTIPPYNGALLRKCAQQITELFNENLNTLMGLKDGTLHEEEQAITMVRMRQSAIEQIKRCCCTYVVERMQRLRHLRWTSGGQVPEAIKEALSAEERKWLTTYNQILFDFQTKFGQDDDDEGELDGQQQDIGGAGDGVNLLNHVEPPKTLMVQVRALRNFGTFETSEGIKVNLSKSSLHFLPRQDCENLTLFEEQMMPLTLSDDSHRRKHSHQLAQPHQDALLAPPEQPALCCALVRHENELLRRALRKEREKRMFATSAYQQLLQQFNQLVDLRTVMVGGPSSLSDSSIASSSSTPTTSRGRRSMMMVEKHKEMLMVAGSRRDAKVSTTPANSPQKQDRRQRREEIRAVPYVECRDGIEGDKENLGESGPTKGTHHRQKQQQQKKKIMGESQSVGVPPSASRSSTSSEAKLKNNNDDNILSGKTAERPNWYFVPLRRGESRENDAAVGRMFARCEQRCDAIREASRARAQIVAGRRAVAADLVTGRRALDAEAINVLLHTDSSRSVHAFPPAFMREQRYASRRCYDKSPVRLRQERERQRHFESAINRILAHSSATMTKMVATGRNTAGGQPRNSFKI
uniref:DNA replication complex GINS protein PSF1 n=1 Tax=Globodera rostochiensis TaxID=31243 RepID=A0A914I7H3_GLORO